MFDRLVRWRPSLWKSDVVHDQLPTDLPSGVFERLTDHCGPSVQRWLREIPAVVTALAARWSVIVVGYHDAGWTSVVASGWDSSGRPVIIKVLPELDRFLQERAALVHWAGAGVCRLLAADEGMQALLIESVTETPGGASRPPDHAARVAKAIPQLHAQAAALDGGGHVPLLTDYYLRSVVPRISRRTEQWGVAVGAAYVGRALELCSELCASPAEPVMLHSDLYAENVLFDEHGEPVFIDPHPNIGSAAFDWAFWCVYYVPSAGFEERVELCRQHTPCDIDEVLAWVVTLAVDGGLYYLDTKDETAEAMRGVLGSPTLAPVLKSRTE